MNMPICKNIAVSYPWLFWLAVYLVLRFYPSMTRPSNGAGGKKLVFINKIPWINPHALIIAALCAVFLRYLYALGFRYESQIAMEVFVPLIVTVPCLRGLVASFRLMALCLFPIMALTVVEQLWCTRFGQWHYLLTNGNNYLLWARQNGRLWERMLYFGGIDYPAIELVFYPAYIIGTFTIAAAAIKVLPRSWRVNKPGYAWFFPAVYAPVGALLLTLCVWFIVTRHTIPFHALAAFMSLFLSWVMFCFSKEVRNLARTKLFMFGTVFSFVQTAIFEFYHAGIDCQWVYLQQNELASLNRHLLFTFPQWNWAGSVSNSWPIEEWSAYPTLFVFITLYLLFFHTALKIPVLRHTIAVEEARGPHS
jgi:hypothetical protein